MSENENTLDEKIDFFQPDHKPTHDDLRRINSNVIPKNKTYDNLGSESMDKNFSSLSINSLMSNSSSFFIVAVSNLNIFFTNAETFTLTSF